MSTKLTYHRGAERPGVGMWLLDDDGTLIDFSVGWTFTLRIGAGTPLLTKTDGITGAAGAGTAPSGTPNVVVEWSEGDLDLTPGPYTWELTARTGSFDRVFSGSFNILRTFEEA